MSIEKVAKIVVIGAGTMGHGIAQVAAMAGFQTTLCDLDAQSLERATNAVRGNLDKGVSRGKVDAGTAKEALARLSTSTSVDEAATDAQVVVEAVYESLELKQKIFKALAKSAPSDAILATNTSSLSLESIANSLEAGARPRFVGMHFFNPVHIMKLVEIVRHQGTSENSVAVAKQLAEKMGKSPIVVADSPGFASSRLGVVIGLEAMRMVEEGVASAEDIDTAMKLGYGHPMGPLELTDHVGLDVRLAISQYLTEVMGDKYAPPSILKNKVESGALGKKTGQGFYTWKDGKKQSADS